MLKCPRSTENLHRFRDGNTRYVADINGCKVVTIDEVAWDILELCPFLTADAIVDRLSDRYNPQTIIETLEEFREMEENQILFSPTDENATVAPTATDRFRILVAQKPPHMEDMTMVAGGVHIAHYNLIRALTHYASVDVMHNSDERFPSGAQGVVFNSNDRTSLFRAMQQDYDGILLKSHTDTGFLSLVDYLEAPTVVPIYSARGHDGVIINAALRWYSVMRPFDAFLVATESVKTLYSRFVFDTEAFHTIPLGVDFDRFHPMDKQIAKNEIARELNDPRITSMPVIGFLSRFQPEKGAGIFIQIAQLLPEAIFLVTVPSLNIYKYQTLPENLICAPQQPRNQISRFLNAFDVYCLPSMVGEETFGLAVLEAMACGVPPVVPQLDGLPEVVGDAGVIVPATAFPDEIGSFAGFVSPFAMAEAIKGLLADDTKRQTLASKAEARAKRFTWDKTAKNLMTLFGKLREIRKLAKHRQRRLPVSFAPYLSRNRRSIQYKAVVTNITELKEKPLMKDKYVQTVEEGLAIALLERHRVHEVEAVLYGLCGESEAKSILEKVLGFQQAIS